MQPEDARDPGAVLARLVEACRDDRRTVAAFLGGSLARGEADEHSDIDVSVIVADDAYAEVVSDKEAFVRTLGEPLFLEDFGIEDVAFVILDDGTDLELHFVRAGDLHTVRSGSHRVLLDEEGILEGLEFPPPEIDREAQVDQLRQIVTWFWHDLEHFTTAIARGQLWWAAGQLEQLRHSCVSLVRIEQGVVVEDEPYWKLDVEISTDALDALRETFAPIEREALLRAGRDVVSFFRRRAPAVAHTHGLEYPTALDELVGSRLDRLDVDR